VVIAGAALAAGGTCNGRRGGLLRRLASGLFF
jgi:hypothetical protein